MNIILYLLIFSSFIWLGIIVYKKIPVLANLSEEEITILIRKKSIIQRIKGIDYKHYWLNFIISLEKFLRRIKIIFLKIENLLTKWISWLRNRSQIMTQKSKEWIRQKEAKRRKDKKNITKETIIKVNREKTIDFLPELDEDDLPIEELKKPIKEEQKWIDLIVENPENITAYKFLGILYWKQHNYSDAKASLEMAVKFGSKDKKVKDILKELKKMNIK
ncbi:hypothetical protein KKE74_01630 [Patescibacteria group bacterium]|nr:hypothetical protein [Patescibacteria group bacterium]MBU2472714.1 hypothetical protein [Patescibacteria group bacterium]